MLAEGLVLLVGWALASVSMMLGYNVLPVLFTLATFAMVYVCRVWDRRSGAA